MMKTPPAGNSADPFILPWVESPFFKEILAGKLAEPIDAATGTFFHENDQLPEFTCYDIGHYAGNLDYGKYEDFMEGLVKAKGFAKKQLLIRKGDVMIYASNLMHGGEKIGIPGSTRWSHITHYYFQDCLYYTPLHSNFLTGKLQHHEIRNVTNGAFVNQSYNGRPFSAIPTGWGGYRITEKFLWVGKIVSQIRRIFYNLRIKIGGTPSGYRE